MTPTLRDRAVKWLRRHPRAATAMATFLLAALIFGGVRAYRLASERSLLAAFWVQHDAITADIDRLEAELAALEEAPRAQGDDPRARRAAMARTELRERIALRSSDARSVSAAILGLTRGRPDARLVELFSTRLKRDVELARSSGDYVRMKVIAETRLALLDGLRAQVEWPQAEVAALRAALAEATAELERGPVVP